MRTWRTLHSDSSSPRKRGSLVLLQRHWIPAFAGMSTLVAVCICGIEAGAQQSPVQKVGGAIQRAAEARAAVKAADRFDETFAKYSKRYFGPAFDWRLFKSQAMAESSMNPDALSPVGARGLMQLMPSTYQEIQTKRPELGPIDDPEFNIAAGVMHDRFLWKLWSREIGEPDRLSFMFGSYNAGQGTIGRAAEAAKAKQLDHSRWSNIETIAATVPRWRYQETLGYVRKIGIFHERMTRSK
jgi:membrane-bound lytic murein transglycosylase MltF